MYITATGILREIKVCNYLYIRTKYVCTICKSIYIYMYTCCYTYLNIFNFHIMLKRTFHMVETIRSLELYSFYIYLLRLNL